MPEGSKPSSLRVLIADDELNIRKTLALSIETDGHEVIAVSNAKDALDHASRSSFDIAFVAGRKRVPRPATGRTALRKGLITIFYLQ